MKKLSVLVGCEESQIVTGELLSLGHEAYSCDIQDSSGNHKERHLKMDIFKALLFKKWDLVILHPPCTKISVSGNRHYGRGKERHKERLDAVKWTQLLWDSSIIMCDFVAMENPVGVLNRYGDFPKPKYVQPWQFGHGETKKNRFLVTRIASTFPDRRG